jgi:EmrB/QacA subfamily drug resistance transporter
MSTLTVDPAPYSRIVPLIIAVALFMENLDSSVLSTSLPAIAVDLATDPIHLKLVLTTYLLALAVFIPASGWVADRFGARLVFRGAIVVFALGSIACGLSQNLLELVLARVLQGIGGSMMVPVGRLILLKTTPRSNLVNAMAWLTMPALIGPLMGPPVGGWITTYWHWRWIFWINIPIAVAGFAFATAFIPDVREDHPRGFDLKGFLLAGPGISAFLSGVTFAGLGMAGPWLIGGLVLGGLALCLLYVRHCFRVEEPLVDLRLLQLQTFRIAQAAGTLFRIGVGATPFLLPLMLQLGFGYTPFVSGLLTFVTALGAMTMKLLAEPILRRFGFRRVLVMNGTIAGLGLLAPGFFVPGMAWGLMAAVLYLGGLSRSLEFTAINAIGYAEVPSAKMSSATSFASVLQQLSGSIGITLAAMTLEVQGWWKGVPATALENFLPAFAVLSVMVALAVLLFRELPQAAGRGLVRGGEAV